MNEQVFEALVQDLSLEIGSTIQLPAECTSFKFQRLVFPAIDRLLIETLNSGYIPEIPPALLTGGSKPFPVEAWDILTDSSGSLKHPVNARIVFILRSIYNLFYKQEVEFTAEQEIAATKKFIAVDETCATWSPESLDTWGVEILRRAARECSRLLSGFDHSTHKWRPQHGPGIVANGERGLDKYRFRSIDDRLRELEKEKFFSRDITGYESVYYRSTDSVPSKTMFVPKDARGPRTICAEPADLMFVQQYYSNQVVELLGKRSRGRINFDRQDVHRSLIESDGSSTLDMQDASDRIPMSLLRCLLPGDFLAACEQTRSQYTRLPDGNVIRLSKFASMGNALTFPVEALVFYSLTVAILSTFNAGVSRERFDAEVPQGTYRPSSADDGNRPGITVKEIRKHVWVYGDDIIISHPSLQGEYLAQFLAKFNLVVNERKSFIRQPFRESCGLDWFDGADVTPFRIRFEARVRDPLVLASMVEASNRAFDMGLWKLSQALEAEAFMYREIYFPDMPLAIGLAHTPGVVFRQSFTKTTGIYRRNRWNSPIVRALTLAPVTLRHHDHRLALSHYLVRANQDASLETLRGRVKPFAKTVLV